MIYKTGAALRSTRFLLIEKGKIREKPDKDNKKPRNHSVTRFSLGGRYRNRTCYLLYVKQAL